jgi:surfactin synthase thioesterase subunit
MSSLEKWFPFRKETGGLELFAFPHIGAAPNLFNPLRTAAGEDGVAITGALLPGRGRRMREEPHHTMEALLAEVEDAARRDEFATFSGDYGLLGHCSGSLVALEVARLLTRLPCPNPRLLVICSSRPPELIPDTGTSRLPRAEMFARTAAIGGTADALLADDDLLDVLERPMRADWEVFDRYTPTPGDPLPLPILAVRGADDENVPAAEQPRWQAYTSEPLHTAEVGRDHWMLSEEGSRALARQIATTLAEIGDRVPDRVPDR